MLKIVSETANASQAGLSQFIEEISAPLSPVAEVAEAARRDANEYELPVPDEQTGRLIATLAARGANPEAGAIVASPAASIVGLYVLEGLTDSAAVTCIDPEAEHTQRARKAVREAGYPSARGRFLTARPLEVLGRMAPGAYQLVFADVSPVDLTAFIDAAWPLLAPGGSLVIADILLDGTIASPSRTDRATKAAREAVEHLQEMAQDPHVRALVTYLPLGAGLAIATKRG
ncbi:methyltransferase [Corynebacterium atypicum]|uniref:Methyltransferase n=1 Tax=Corynebacterium atypicum TaxID=191610 RepID=A0ABM5QNH2_9CORY|nr:methyltransferase [Corynebacterium atypicum]